MRILALVLLLWLPAVSAAGDDSIPPPVGPLALNSLSNSREVITFAISLYWYSGICEGSKTS